MPPTAITDLEEIMPDEADRYGEITDQAQERFMRRRAAAAGKSARGPSHCACGEPIPGPRRDHGFSDCVACAEDAERQLARGRALGAL